MHRFGPRSCVGALVAAGALALAPGAGAATAPAQVFAPNPVADLGIQSLTDQKDADYFSADPALRRAYHRVTLTDLTSAGALSGAYVAVQSETRPAAANTGGGSVFTRDQDQFEQVMAYYWITQAQRAARSAGKGDDALREVSVEHLNVAHGRDAGERILGAPGRRPSSARTTSSPSASCR